MIAANFTNEPRVSMDVAWFDKSASLHDIADRTTEAVHRAWPFVAVAVEIARRNNPAGVLRVMVDARPESVTRVHFDNRHMWYAEAECNWTRDTLPAGVWGRLRPEEKEIMRTGADETHTTVVVLVRDATMVHVSIQRVEGVAPHAEFLAMARECGMEWPGGVLRVSPLHSMFDPAPVDEQ